MNYSCITRDSLTHSIHHSFNFIIFLSYRGQACVKACALQFARSDQNPSLSGKIPRLRCNPCNPVLEGKGTLNCSVSVIFNSATGVNLEKQTLPKEEPISKITWDVAIRERTNITYGLWT